jgi:hypothetical protein
MLTLADGTFSPWLLKAVPWGRVSGPAGLTPEALQERECSCRGFFARPSSRPRCTMRTCLVLTVNNCIKVRS